MAIKIIRNEEGNCIQFEGTTLPVYWNACLSAKVNSSNSDNIDIVNNIETGQTGIEKQELTNEHYTNFLDKDGNAFANVQETIDYINSSANATGITGNGIDLSNQTVCFSLDATSTSIMLDNGYSFGVNTIKAISNGGVIEIVSNDANNNILHFFQLDHTNTCVNGQPVSGGLNDVINTLNELFTVGAFESVVIADPYSTMIADVSGEDTSLTYIGNGIDVIGDDVYGSTSSNSQNGLLTTETINQAGEYFTFDIRVEGTIGFGLVHTQDSYDNGYWSGYQPYADPTRFGIDNSAHYGFQFSHWFHPTPNGSWTNYGANTSFSRRSGWSDFNGTDEQNDWLAGNPIKVRVGIDENGYISIDTLRDGVNWVAHSRTSYPVVQGSEFRLGIKTNHTGARVYSLPKVHLLEEAAPTMYFRYIESPDGVFHYPLFTTVEEAKYYDEIHNGLTAGSGSSHTHTYADDPTNTTWYMPEASHDANEYQHSSAPNGTETFNGNTINWTEITSLTNADLTPTAYSGSDITQQEGTNVNIQVTPQGASWSTSVSITPSGSGLVYDGYSVIQGTLADVGSDTTYTITVTRANSYGSSVGTFTVTATDVAPPTTNLTPWTKALDFSGSNEHLKQVNSGSYYNAIRMGYLSQLVSANADSSKTSNDTYSRPWATAIVFKSDFNNSNQHIWNSGEGSGTNDDNIYLRTDSNGLLYFGWGRQGALNECRLGGQAITGWRAVYIAHKGQRFNGSNATASNLADAFDIRVVNPTNNWDMTYVYNVSTSANWITTGGRMDRLVSGDFTIGGRGSNRSFHGKVASMIVTTLRKNVAMPTNAEIELMISDPKKWEDDYRIGQTIRDNAYDSEWTYLPSSFVRGYGNTQIWLMGDGTSDSYANGIRNEVYPSEQNYTKGQLNSMVSNDIVTVNINGLT
tara:strand:- start:3 stop:2753 length:2751 start_codon:yes stop_codon:yes gene_type:complete